MKVADLFARLGLKTDKRSFSQADRMLGTVKKALIGIVAFRTVKWFGSMITDTAKAADNFAKMSRKVGISIEALQQLEFAAGISGTNLATLRVGLQRFARVASDADRGLKTALDPLKDVNVAFKDGEGNLRALDEMLMDVADAFAQMPNGTKKTALAMELFGRSGAELIPLLNEGRSGIGKLREEFVELGAQIDGQTAKSFEEFNDDQLRVKTALKGIRNQVVIALLPTLKEMVKSMLAWVKANREFIRQKLASVLKSLVGALKFFAKVVGFAVEHWQLLLGLFIGAQVLAAVTKLTTAIALLGWANVKAAAATAASWMVATLPLILLAALVAALITMILDMFGVFGDGDNVFRRLREWLVDAFVGWIETVVREWKVFFSWFKDKAREAADFAKSVLLDTGFLREGGKDVLKIAGVENTFASAVRRTPSAAGNTSNNQFEANINIEGASDPGETGKAVQRALSDFWDAKTRDLASATEQ